MALAFLCQLVVTGSVLVLEQAASRRALVEQERDSAYDMRDSLLAVYGTSGRKGLVQDIETRFKTLKGERVVILLLDPDNRELAGNIVAWPRRIPKESDWRVANLYRKGNDTTEPVGVTAIRLPDGSHLLSGTVIGAGERLIRLQRGALTIAFLVGILLTLVMAFIFGKLLTNKVSAIADTANAVASGRLSERVASDGSGDAFDALGRAINAMLDRIEALVTQLRMMTDGLAHDLKSPVTRLVSSVERAFVDAREESSLAALDRISREAEALQSMLSTALLISRTEAGFGSAMLVETDVSAMLEDIAEIYGPVAEDSAFSISVDVPESIKFPLHRELVGQAIGNLIENALKYAEGGNRIALAAMMRDGDLLIQVRDNGNGIPADQRTEALKRFGRLDPARSKPGSGLGLSLVEAVCRLHHGSVALADANPGLVVTVLLRK